ncbi:MAG: SDR family NAD(P)-dependent oxidoreductase [Deltaproteobacteria bacterium]|nr:SDR family NAD(P)-dependent oxidoreductase [Deltaproteobacteria bacterium]
MEVNGCVAIVTGGASGLGEACVRNLVGAGAKAAILDLAEGKGSDLAAEFGNDCIFCKTDVTGEGSVQAAINETMVRFGAIHVAVNCAGVATPAKVLGKKGPLSIQGFEMVVRINLIGTMNVIRLAAEQMMKNEPNEDGERGVVINTASGAAFEGQIGQAAYSASKAGVVGMTLPIAREFASYGIRNVTIAPGLFDTPMLGGMPDPVRQSLIATCLFPRRMGKAAEFAQLVRQIIENAMLNGATLRLDGALRLAPK